MSTSARAISPDDPRLTEVPLEIDTPDPIKTPQALTILAAGLTAKARAVEDCYQFVYVYRCKNNHMWPVPITCHQRFCPNCAEALSLALIERYSAIDIGIAPFLYLEVSQVGDLTPEFVQSFQSMIST